jgi:hypothetical protein
MPYGNVPAGGFCPQCGCALGPQGFGGQMMPGTFARNVGFGGPGMGFGGPGMGFGGPGMGFGPGMGPGAFGYPWTGGWMRPTSLGWGLGGSRRWGGTYSPQFIMTGLPTDDEIVEMVYDAIDADPLIPFDADITVDSDAGTVTLTGTVATKEIKHAAGDDAWWIPGVDDVHNDLTVERRRPSMAERREEAAEARPARAAGVTRMRR